MAITVRMMLAGKKIPGIKSIAPDAKVLTALQLMERDNIGSLLVMGEGRFLGIVTERDITRKVDIKGRSSADTPVRDIMTCCEELQVKVVTPYHTLPDCLLLMDDNNIHHLPVVEEEEGQEKVIGVISMKDIMKEIAKRSDELDNTLDAFPVR